MKNINEIIKESKKIALYERVSTKRQKEDMQEEVINSFLREKEIGDKVKKYTDIISAYNKPYTQRADLEKLIKDAKNKEIDTVIVSSEDRISRQPKEHQILRKLFRELELDVIIASKGETYNTDDLIKNILVDGMTKYEVDVLSTRTHHAMQELIKQEKWTGGKPPYGYQLLKHEGRVLKFTPVPDEIKRVKLIFQWYQKGHSFNFIADELSKGKNVVYETKKRKWSANSVKHIITNPFYCGYLVYNRSKGKNGGNTLNPRSDWIGFKCDWIEDPPITMAEWEYCWERYTLVKDKAPKFQSTPFIFNGLLICSCNEFMKGKDQTSKGKRKVYGDYWYICVNCRNKVLADSLHGLFKRYWRTVWLNSVENSTEIRSRFLEVLDQKRSMLDHLVREMDGLKKTLNDLEGIRLNGPPENVLLNSKEEMDPLMIAYLITREDVESQLIKNKKTKEQYEYEIKQLESLLRDESKYFSKFLLKINSLEFDNMEQSVRRSMAQLFIRECRLSIDNKISFKFNTIPDKSFPIEIRRMKN
ncbi:recombinase family protein [Peribacillus kribbensis]|uniref:recombinase family protein n=1 Tax=Peribacillus kribbensis TaxID=356658 RepID=UPI000420FB54|nr:recombinase family protein [Peribacillus kribbensis]